MVVIYDIETLASCFTYTDYCIETKNIYQAVLHKDRFELSSFYNHLKKIKGQIGFNNLEFDYPVLHYILKNYNNWLNKTNEEIITLIYNEAQRLIKSQNSPVKVYNAIRAKDVIIQQLDLFKIWHYNNKARMTSLKSLEISMNYPNVMDMPIHHNDINISLEQVDGILEYNLNDVMATYEFYNKSLAKIQLRKSLKKQYNIDCLNWSDSKIGEELILKLYSKENDITPYELKNLRSERLKIALKDIILDYISFNSSEFTNLLNYFKNKEITETKGSIECSVIYKGFKYDYGTGGIHGSVKSGIYESDNKYMIIDADVSSLYPSLAITNGFYPEHLGLSFVEIYKSIITLRLQAKKEGNMVLSDGFKLAANSVYGKSNDKHSFLYDPKFTMAITVNGQLLLTKLAEYLTNIPESMVIQINTDGITMKIPRNHEQVYYDICKEWEKETKLQLEYVEYSKMVIGDVNNYLAVTTKGKIKNKGRFEVDKVVGSEPAYHKDNSFRIIPLALQEYFVKGVPIEDTVKNHTNIYDFCGRQKFKGEDCGFIRFINNDKITEEIQQKNVRYYISNRGASFIKNYAKGSQEIINKGYLVTIFNKYIEKNINNYNLNYEFYIKEINKEINNIINKQLSLF